VNSSGSATHSDANGREVGRARTSGTILVVDDELAVRRLFSAALKRRGFETLEAEDGPSALNVIASTPIDLVLIDHNMPGMTGMQVLKEIRSEERTRTLPVIMVTGEDGTPSRIRGLDVGANDYVVKTTHIDELVARVRAQLRTTVAWAELIGHELQDRARLVTALGAVPAADSPEATAAALVDRLAGLDGVAFIALLQADPTGGLTPLAGWTATKGPWVGGQSLARSTSKQFLSRAEAGPWTEATSEQPSQHTGRFLPSEVAAIHAAPLRLADRVVGMLVLGTPRVSTPLAPTGDLLAAAIDYAAVATAVLGPALKARGQMTSERSRLERIIAEGAFHPVFQPLVGLGDGEVIGYEALTRFADGVPPDVRFAEAARVGLRRMYEQATLTAALEAAQELPEGKWLGVNVSPELVLEPDWLADCLKGSTRRLVVELTEHAPIDDYAKLREMLETLPTRVAVAVDDAGAGYASLRHIYELRPHFVKLDIGLVRGVNKDPLRQALIAGLVHFADDTGSRLIAEGIETEAEAATMRRLHVRIGQGFLFGRPAQVEPRRAETDAEALPAGRPSA
jgi:EAL domain-containing protein (putative c-di-GMP-specific phosphodiesterase class I)/DNA-binding response OmpR family regulator